MLALSHPNVLHGTQLYCQFGKLFILEQHKAKASSLVNFTEMSLFLQHAPSSHKQRTTTLQTAFSILNHKAVSM